MFWGKKNPTFFRSEFLFKEAAKIWFLSQAFTFNHFTLGWITSPRCSSGYLHCTLLRGSDMKSYEMQTIEKLSYRKHTKINSNLFLFSDWPHGEINLHFLVSIQEEEEILNWLETDIDDLHHVGFNVCITRRTAMMFGVVSLETFQCRFQQLPLNPVAAVAILPSHFLCFFSSHVTDATVEIAGEWMYPLSGKWVVGAEMRRLSWCFILGKPFLKRLGEKKIN